MPNKCRVKCVSRDDACGCTPWGMLIFFNAQFSANGADDEVQQFTQWRTSSAETIPLLGRAALRPAQKRRRENEIPNVMVHNHTCS